MIKITHTVLNSNLNSYFILGASSDLKKFYSTNNTVVPERKYQNADIEKIQILKENKNKSGIYRWINLVNQKTYIGSSAFLKKRFRGYYSINHLESRIKRARSQIYSAILKYGYSNFSLEILEYVSLSELISKEQYYIDLLKPPSAEPRLALGDGNIIFYLQQVQEKVTKVALKLLRN